MSIAGGIANAIARGAEAGCDTVALFSGSPRVWRRQRPDMEAVQSFVHHEASTGIQPVILHALYLANLAAPDPAVRARSVESLMFELDFAELLGIKWVVLHPGSHRGQGMTNGIAQCARSLNEVFTRSSAPKAGVALETVSGAGDAIGASFQQLGDLLARCTHQARLSLCIDTCHIFAAGYDIRADHGWHQTAEEVDEAIGLDRVTVLHLNDSKTPLGSTVDRHTHIGEGFIGIDGFRAIVNDQRLVNVPMILETPKGNDHALDKKNLATLRSLLDHAEGATDGPA
jgi:deoxyribonuclease-4